MVKQPPIKLREAFTRAAASRTEAASDQMPRMARPARDTPSSDAAVRNYMINLEGRLIHHLHRHAPRWVGRETRDLVERWSAPALKPPAPFGAAPRDLVRDARWLAEHLVMARVKDRLVGFHAIRMARGFTHDPLGDRHRAIFGTQSATLKHKHSHKQ